MINFTTCKVEECNSEDQLLTHPSPVRVVAEFDCHPSKRSLRSRGIWASRAKRRVLCGATNPLLSFRGAKATRNLQFSSNSTADPSGSCLRYQPRNSSGLFWSRLEFEGIGGIIGAESNRGSGMKPTLILCCILTMVALGTSQEAPKRNYVPNSETAIAIAEAVFIPVFGKTGILYCSEGRPQPDQPPGSGLF